jgi:hypothetical protein
VGTFGPRAVAVGTLDPGGSLDVLVASYDGGLAAMLGDGRGRLRVTVGSSYLTGGLHPSAVAAGDFNRDGRLDAVVANRDSDNVSVLLSQGLLVERRCRVVRRPSRMSRSGVVTFKLFCPFAARGRATIRVGERRAGRGRFKVRRAGDAARVRVKLSRSGRQQVKRATQVTAQVQAVAYRGKARKRGKTYNDTLTIRVR